MSDLPPTDPYPQNDDRQPPAPALRWPGAVAWAVIGLVVGLILISSAVPEVRGRRQPKNSGDAAADMQQLLSAKVALGARALAGSAAPATRPATASSAPDADAASVVRQVDAAARTPVQRLRAAIVAGELLGPDAALERIARIEPSTQPATGPYVPATAPSTTPSADDESAKVRADAEALATIYSSGPDAQGEDARQRLVARHGFFGRLALAFGRADNHPQRAAVLAEATRATVVISVIGVAGLIGILLGLALLVTWVVLLNTGTVRRALVPPARAEARTVFVEMFAVYLVAFLVCSIVLSLVVGERPNLAWNYALTLAVPAALAWGVLRGLSGGTIRDGLGWHAGRGLHVEVPLGVVGYVAGLPIVVLGFILSFTLTRLAGATPTHPLQFAPADSPGAALQLYLLACVWAPLVEETMFRGALYAHLRIRWHWLASAAVVAFVFAAIHPQGWTFIPVLGSIGFALAMLREWRGSIAAPVVAHACNNFVMVSLLLAIK